MAIGYLDSFALVTHAHREDTVYLIDPVRTNIEEGKKIGQEVNVCSLKNYIVGDV